MNETITYQWSEEVALSTKKAQVKATSKIRPILFFAFGIIMIFGGFQGYFLQFGDIQGYLALVKEAQSLFPNGDSSNSGFFIVILGVILFVTPFRSLHNIKQAVRDAGKLLNDPTVTISITDDSIIQSSSAGSLILQWNNVSKLKEINSTILLWTGKTLVTSFPRTPFSESQLEFMKSKVNNK